MAMTMRKTSRRRRIGAKLWLHILSRSWIRVSLDDRIRGRIPVVKVPADEVQILLMSLNGMSQTLRPSARTCILPTGLSGITNTRSCEHVLRTTA